MDGQTTSGLKTVTTEDIMGTIAKNDLSARQGYRAQDGRQMTDSPHYWNPEDALARVEGDEELLRELIQLFLDDYPNTMRELRTAVSAGDVRSLERHAHTLKGAAANFEAVPTVTAGLELETSAFQKDLTNVPRQMQNLDTALAELRAELEAFLHSNGNAG